MTPSTAILLLASFLATICGRCCAEESCLAPSDTTTRPEMAENEFEAKLRAVKCGVYVAPSTIKDAGNGVYTAVDMPQVGMSLASDTPVRVVFNTGIYQLWDNYQFEPHEHLAEYEGTKEMNIGILGFGVAIKSNFFPGSVNAATFVPEHNFYKSLDGQKDPGAGAFSDYYEKVQNTKLLSAGDEIFISYGEGWFESRRGESLSSRYHEVDALDDDNTGANDDRTLTSNPQRRSVKWLEDNGSCMDHMYIKESRVPQAGRGAFTRRFIQGGDVLISDQMLLIKGGREVLRRRTDKGADVLSPGDQQQLTNYVYSHPDSAVFFLPTSLAGMINHHSSSRMGKEKGPNVEMRWSQTDKKTQHFLNMPPEKFPKDVMVVLDFVATRDIAVDEEVLVDYGESWQEAWDQHVAHWVPPKDTTATSAKVSAMNSNKFDTNNWGWSNSHFTTCREGIDGEAVSLEDGFVKEHLEIDSHHLGFHLLEFDSPRSQRVPCIVGQANKEAETVSVFYFVEDDGTRFLGFVKDLPAAYLSFVSLPLSSDQHRNDGHRFVHEVEIQNFPEIWKVEAGDMNMLPYI
eukprot:CAMPEP_0194269234 /NCGR_PEP_ID=MMETSP0169-20130528/3417_1 /TAXON_ID=218684 /ORGANISM="Corethron pennatum, Strain L29A3" /LENGTH=571 /DNA_ID=CAMNT_0039010807 /DNA_START=100 /DNA_END=1815 /DNA_ORIENTATION=-